MVDEDGPRRLAARRSEPRVIKRKEVDGLLARMQGDAGDAGQRQDQRGQRRVIELGRKRHGCGRFTYRYGEAQRKPAQLDGKHHEGDKAQPKRRGRRQHVAVSLDNGINRGPALCTGGDPKAKARNARYAPRDGEQNDGTGKLFGNNLYNGSVVPKAVPQVSGQRVGNPCSIARENALANAPALRERSPLFSTHGKVCRLPDICLHGIDGRHANK